MSSDLKNKIKLSVYCDKSQRDKHGWNDRKFL